MGPNLPAWATLSMIMNGRLYLTPVAPYSAFQAGYYMFATPSPVSNNFTAMAPNWSSTAQFGMPMFWLWDSAVRRLWRFNAGQSGLGLTPMQPTPASPAAWDLANVGMDLVTMQTYGAGGWLITTDGSKHYVLGFTDASVAQVNTTKKEFTYASLLKPNTIYCTNRLTGEIYFSSGNKIYMYNPNGELAPELMTASLEGGDVTMLKFKSYQQGTQMFANLPDFKSLWVGTEGHLYELDLNGNVGSRGAVKKDTAIKGAPADIYNRKTTLD